MMNPLPFHDLDVDASLRTILEGTATETGERFFAALVENLARALNTHGAWVTEYIEEQRRLKALAFWMGGNGFTAGRWSLTELRANESSMNAA
jgi:hypothetical protein